MGRTARQDPAIWYNTSDMQDVVSALKNTVKDLFGIDADVVLTRPAEQFGEYATNIALQLAGKVHLPPHEVAAQVVVALKDALTEQVTEVTVAGPGFINIKLSDNELLGQAAAAPHQKPTTYKDQVVVAEYSDPNPFKVLHAGHFYTSVVGYGIASLLEAAGATVHRVNYGGDVGLHAGKTMWAILQDLGGEHPEKLAGMPKEERSSWMAACYVKGNNLYEEDEAAKQEMRELNKKLYQLHTDNDHTSPLAQIYWTCRQWSYDYLDEFYARIGTPFEKYYPESEVAPLGLKTVKEQLAKGVYEESDGAVIFRGEPYGLHTRVFINKEGLPTYEAKDIGLVMCKYKDYNFDRSVVITGNEQEQYMAVVLKSLEQFAPELANATTHFTHGLVKLKGGVKMSSRKGNILRATDVLDIAKEANKKATGRENEDTVLAAIKYTFLKNRIGADIIFDPEESVSLEGNSGPYLQYAHARACSILAKGDVTTDVDEIQTDLDPLERSLTRKIAEYPGVMEKAVNEMMPHHICTYLYELAQTFNRFYEKSRVIGDEREAVRLLLVSYYADVLKDGLQLLNITAPDRL